MASNWLTLAWLAAAFGCGAIDAEAWAILAAAWGLTSMRIEAMSPVVDKYAAVIGQPVGLEPILGLGVRRQRHRVHRSNPGGLGAGGSGALAQGPDSAPTQRKER